MTRPAAPPMLADVAIFPLSTVLFPGGVLPLRVFEARYMDMVRDCMHRELPFGVCQITRGAEVGEAAEHEPVGCLAHIRGWDMEQLGVLQLRTVGGSRFRRPDRRVARSGLIHATLDPIAEDPPAADARGVRGVREAACAGSSTSSRSAEPTPIAA